MEADTMDGEGIDDPKLIFFQKKPADLLAQPPLASSLQHLETSFLLITMWRYPHALVSCASAIESGLKAAFRNIPKSKQTFELLLDYAREHLPSNAAFTEAALDEFRKKRNQIIHHGFSPKDDEISAILLLKTGYSLVEHCYETFFRFPLRQKGETGGGLLPDIDHHLAIATSVYLKAKKQEGLSLKYCFLAFGQLVRWRIQHWMMSDWQQEILAQQELNAAWDYKHKQKEQLTRGPLDPSWNFDCPVCRESESFVSQLDSDALRKARVTLTQGVCVNCGLIIPAGCPYLADDLCAIQVEAAHSHIMKEFGIA
jgi:hypothetical protein